MRACLRKRGVKTTENCPVSLLRSAQSAIFTDFPVTRPQFLVSKTKSDKPLTFEAALSELESIVAAMEAGELALEKSLSAYKRGAELLQFCQSQLQEAQQQVKVLEANSLKTLTGDQDAD